VLTWPSTRLAGHDTVTRVVGPTVSRGALGALTGDEKLKAEGKLDQLAGKLKDATEIVVDKVKTAVKGS